MPEAKPLSHALQRTNGMDHGLLEDPRGMGKKPLHVERNI